MKLRFIACTLFAITLIFTISSTSQAQEPVLYPSIIEEYDELYFLENIYMENVYYENYYAKDENFIRMELQDNAVAQEFQTQINTIYTSNALTPVTLTLEHNLNCSFEEYVDIIMNTYIDFIKYYQYQETIIQPDFSTCSFSPYVKFNDNNECLYCTDVNISYLSYH